MESITTVLTKQTYKGQNFHKTRFLILKKSDKGRQLQLKMCIATDCSSQLPPLFQNQSVFRPHDLVFDPA